MIPVGTHPEAVAGTLTMETTAFSVRPPMGARPDRSGSDSGFGPGHLDFISMAMNMARPHPDDLEAMPTRPPRPLVPAESQASDEFEDRPRGPGTMVLAPRDISS